MARRVGSRTSRSRSSPARCSDSSAPTGRERRRRSGPCSICCIRPAARARLFGLDSRRDSVAIRARLGNLPGDFGYGKETRARGDSLARPPSRRTRTREGGVAGGQFRADLARRSGSYPGGNRQKVGLIPAPATEPELLVLDEPTGGLDPLMQEEFLTMVAERRARGCDGVPLLARARRGRARARRCETSRRPRSRSSQTRVRISSWCERVEAAGSARRGPRAQGRWNAAAISASFFAPCCPSGRFRSASDTAF